MRHVSYNEQKVTEMHLYVTMNEKAWSWLDSVITLQNLVLRLWFMRHKHSPPVFWGRVCLPFRLLWHCTDRLLDVAIMFQCTMKAYVWALLLVINSPLTLLLSPSPSREFRTSEEHISELKKRLWNRPRLATMLLYIVMFLQSGYKPL